MSVGMSTKHQSGFTPALRRATADDHASVDGLVDLPRLTERGYYAAVLGGLIAAAEAVEATLPRIPRALWVEGLSPAEVSKRAAIDAESSFLDTLGGSRPDSPRVDDIGGQPLTTPGRAAMVGLVYVYVGSALGGLHLLRVARTASWWQIDREQSLLRPYGDHLQARWRAVLEAVDHVEAEEADTAIAAARAGFDLHRRALVAHLSAGGHR
ncbi:heme oxygenase [Mycobacterium sp. BK558]|nr:heme oxygenase [Mycobacterium sp. BK558]